MVPFFSFLYFILSFQSAFLYCLTFLYLFLPRTVSWPIRAIRSARHHIIAMHIARDFDPKITQEEADGKKSQNRQPKISQILRKSDFIEKETKKINQQTKPQTQFTWKLPTAFAAFFFFLLSHFYNKNPLEFALISTPFLHQAIKISDFPGLLVQWFFLGQRRQLPQNHRIP